jgi:hypothetical protein
MVVTEENKIKAQLGAGEGIKGKNSTERIILNEQGKTLILDDLKFTDSLYFKKCSDSTFEVNSLCVKIFVEECKNMNFVLNGKVITETLEVWKCEAVNVKVNTKVHTLQVDLCKETHFHFTDVDHFNRMVWAGSEDLHLCLPNDLSLKTGMAAMKENNSAVVDSDQFIVRVFKNKLNGKLQIANELVVRLQNGFPTTEREAREFDQRQEENLQKLAKELLGKDISIGKKLSSGPKVGRNDVCTCGSGKKYKKCCGTDVYA